MAALGTYQTTLFAQGDPAVVADAAVHRIWLDDTSWVDLSRSWLVGADELLARLATSIPWARGCRPMYGRLVDEPRLHASLDLADAGIPRHRDRHGAGARCPLRRGVRLVVSQLLPRRSRLGCVARRPGRPPRDRPPRGGRVARRSPSLPSPTDERRTLGAPRARLRRPARDGWRLPAPLGALRAQDALGSTADEHHPAAGGQPRFAARRSENAAGSKRMKMPSASAQSVPA